MSAPVPGLQRRTGLLAGLAEHAGSFHFPIKVTDFAPVAPLGVPAAGVSFLATTLKVTPGTSLPLLACWTASCAPCSAA